ncbi:hypothetical protein Tco_0712401 [Tanacetum coccineum]
MDPMISLGQKNTLAEYMILSGADNRPPMLDKDLYDSWKSIMELYMQNREHGRMILESVEHGPLIWPTVEENGVIRTKKYAKLSAAEKIQADCDMKATNIILQGLPADIYSLVNHHRVAKDLWERVQLLMQGTSLTKQERECKLYDAFDKFTHIKGESLHTYYLRFTQLINDMNIYKMNMEQFQVNTKFLNSLPPEWSKFVTDVKLVKDLHTSNFDQLHAYLEQHELHANEVRIMRERNQDPLAFVANQQMTQPHFNPYQSSYNNPQLQQQFSPSHHASIQPNQHYSSHYPSQTQFNHSSIPPSPSYHSQMNHQTSTVPQVIPQVAYQSPQPPTQLMTESPFGDSGFVVLVFSPRDDPIACLNKAMTFLIVVASSRFPTTNNQLKTSSNPRNQAIIQDGRVTVQQVQGRQGQNYSGTTYKSNATSSRGNNTSGQTRVVKCYNYQAQEAGQILDEEQLVFLADPGIPASQAQTVIPHIAAFQTEDLDTYDSDCDDLSTAKAVLMANISNYGSDIISEVPNSDTYLNDMDNQSVHAVQNFEQTPVMNFTNSEISSDSNIIPYSQYLQETQQATVQDTHSQAQQDSMILSVIEQMFEQMINHVNNWEKANKEHNNESITSELERYKERVKIFKQRLNIDLSSREKMIDSQMDDMIREKLALKEQIDSLEQNLSKQIKERESLFETFSAFKNESKEEENKYVENEIDLEKKIKELDNIICKVGQSAQTMHMLTEPQAFYDNTHKQALGYQNPFHLKKAQRLKPTLYDGVVLSNTHVAMPVIDDEETLILEEESRSKMSEKAKNPEVIAKKISHKPIDYANLNSLIDDFETRFSPQQELSAEQAFWFHIHNPSIESSYTPPVIMEVPSELPKVSLVNASLKKLKFHLTQFDSVVKKRTTPNALEEDLQINITEVQTVFDQIDAAVQQSSVDKQCLEIAKKEILLENDRLLHKIMSQEVLLTVMNSMSLNNDFVNMKKCDSCEKCLNLDAELSKSKQAYNDLLKNHSQLEKHCISLEVSMQLKHEVFQNDKSCVNHNAVEIQEYFEINDLKAQLQDKDKTICKLKDTIRTLSKNANEENVNHDKCKLEPINEELENSVATLLSENERLCNGINHVKQVFKDQFDSIKQTRFRHKEHIEQAKAKQPLDGDLDLACKYATRIQELLVYVQDTCPNAITPSTKKVESSNTSDSNTPVLSSTGVKCSTSNCGSKPPGNKKNDRISQTPSRNKKNKVEAQPRKVNKMNRVVKPV